MGCAATHSRRQRRTAQRQSDTLGVVKTLAARLAGNMRLRRLAVRGEVCKDLLPWGYLRVLRDMRAGGQFGPSTMPNERAYFLLCRFELQAQLPSHLEIESWNYHDRFGDCGGVLVAAPKE